MPMSATMPTLDPARSEIQSFWERVFSAVSRRYREPLLDALTPHLPVRVVLADGGEALWRTNEALQPAPSVGVASSGAKAGLTAIEYPEARLLRKQLVLPDMTAAEAALAAELDAVTSSPFRSDDLVWGHRCQTLASGNLQVDIVLASRKQVQQHLDEIARRLAGPAHPETWAEVWALAGSSAPVVIRGFGEGRRISRQARQRRLLYGLLFLAWGLAAGIAITPTAQIRMRAIQAVKAFDTLHQKTGALVLKRESLSKTADQLAAMDQLFTERVQALEIMGLLTRALPDDSSLLTLQILGSKVRLTGQTSNTADLMQKLSEYPGLRDVKSPSAATRPLGANKESFSIELELMPAALTNAQANRGKLSTSSTAIPAEQKASSP